MKKNNTIKKLHDFHVEGIKSPNKNVEDYISLIILYWDVSQDYGLNSHCISNNIFTGNYIKTFPEKIRQLMIEAKNEFSNNKEILFWEIYIDENQNFSPCTNKDKVLALICDNFLLPFFYLDIQCGVYNNIDKLELLKKELNFANDSYKKFYLLSYLSNE